MPYHTRNYAALSDYHRHQQCCSAGSPMNRIVLNSHFCKWELSIQVDSPNGKKFCLVSTDLFNSLSSKILFVAIDGNMFTFIIIYLLRGLIQEGKRYYFSTLVFLYMKNWIITRCFTLWILNPLIERKNASIILQMEDTPNNFPDKFSLNFKAIE